MLARLRPHRSVPSGIPDMPGIPGGVPAVARSGPAAAPRSGAAPRSCSGRRSRVDERGASAVEYGLLVAGIAAVIVGIVFSLGGLVHDRFTSVSSCIAAGTPTPSPCP